MNRPYKSKVSCRILLAAAAFMRVVHPPFPPVGLAAEAGLHPPGPKWPAAAAFLLVPYVINFNREAPVHKPLS